MDQNLSVNQPFTKADDAEIFEEAAVRLCKQYRGQHGIDFQFGCFEFVFHDGRFQGIEERPRFKRYRSLSRLSIPKIS